MHADSEIQSPHNVREGSRPVKPTDRSSARLHRRPGSYSSPLSGCLQTVRKPTKEITKKYGESQWKGLRLKLNIEWLGKYDSVLLYNFTYTPLPPSQPKAERIGRRGGRGKNVIGKRFCYIPASQHPA